MRRTADRRRPPRTTARTPDAPEDHLGYLFKRLQHAIRHAVDEAMRGAGLKLSFAHIATLFALTRQPGLSGARIAKDTMVTAQTVNTLLRRLEAEGSVERRPHPDNRRIDRWYVTARGRRQMQAARAAGEPVWDAMLAALAPAEITQLRDLLKRCIAGLERGRAGAPAAASCLPPCGAPARSRASRSTRPPSTKGTAR